MEILYLGNNELIGEIPVEIGTLTNLMYLGLQFNQLTGEIPVEIGNLINLGELWLNNNQFTGEIPESICNVYENLPIDYEVFSSFCDVKNTGCSTRQRWKMIKNGTFRNLMLRIVQQTSMFSENNWKM